MQKENKLYLGDCLKVMPQIKTDSIDAIVTDPPYGISFMGKDWDKAVPSIAIWQECLRVLKPGAFAFVMCIPRQDCLARMICRLEDAGFNIGFSSIYWTYATGFPKAQNLSKKIDQRAGVDREIIGFDKQKYRPYNGKGRGKSEGWERPWMNDENAKKKRAQITVPSRKEAKTLDGAYSGFQPKPAVEIVIVAMKPLSEKTYVDQAMVNKHGCTWLDNCRIPFENKNDKSKHILGAQSNRRPKLGPFQNSKELTPDTLNIQKGRFPANVLCEDDVLNDGNTRKSGNGIKNSIRDDYYSNMFSINRSYSAPSNGGDTGSFSRYFSLDAWFAERIKHLPKEAQKTFPWLIVPKASKAEKYQNLDIVPEPSKRPSGIAYNKHSAIHSERKGIFHPTIKPIKLMSWLITLASREGDIILDPFCGSGTTLIAAKMLNRQYIGIESKKEYYDIARLRIDETPQNLDKFL